MLTEELGVFNLNKGFLKVEGDKFYNGDRNRPLIP